MTNNSKMSVIAVGLNFIERETLQSVFRLSNRYRLIPLEEAADADIALVNLDDPDTLLYWKSNIDRPDLTTIVVAEHAGRYGELIYLERRFMRRRCFAKRVLAMVDRAALKRAALIQETETDRAAAPAASLFFGVLRLVAVNVADKFRAMNAATVLKLTHLNGQIEASVAAFQAELVNATHRDEITTRRQVDI